MKNRKLKKSKKIKNLVSICALCAILLSVSTYAWFIGMKTVNVTEFDINIATTEGLWLSMDGSDWRYTLDAKNTPAYTNNANQWLDGTNEGLIPMSSIGEMDEASSRMKLYEKGSLTAVTGGYRLLASRVDNNVTQNAGGIEYEEGNGYIAFDLFIKNLSGEAYYPEDNVLNEEAIYLNTNSAVTVALDGEGNAGIENSVRVGFVQLGRVSAALDTDDEVFPPSCLIFSDASSLVILCNVPVRTKVLPLSLSEIFSTGGAGSTPRDFNSSNIFIFSGFLKKS